MTRNEFLTRFSKELTKRNIADAADIMEEYEQHFAFKMADGYSEEEIAAKLGDPAGLAAQYEPSEKSKKPAGRKLTTVIGLCFADVFAGIFFIFMAAWGIVFAAAGVSFAAAAVCLFGNLGFFGLIPPIPYWCGVVIALCALALSALSFIGFVWFIGFFRQLMRSFFRFQHNALAESRGEPALPPLPIAPQFSPKKKRALRTAALISLMLMASCFVLSYVVCALSAGSFQFWHVWGWFIK